MLPSDNQTMQKANEWMRDTTNHTFALFQVPARVKLVSTGLAKSMFQINWLENTPEAAVKKMYEVQVRIMQKTTIEEVTRDEALFMAMSHWFDWLLSGGSVNDPFYPYMLFVTHRWITVFNMKGGISTR